MVDWVKLAINVLVVIAISIFAERVFGFRHLAIIPLALGSGIGMYYHQKRTGKASWF